MSIKVYYVELGAAVYSDDKPSLVAVKKKIRQAIKELGLEEASLDVSGPYEVDV